MAYFNYPFSLLFIVLIVSSHLRPASADTAFNQTVLRTLNTSNPALRQASQLAFDTGLRQLLVADLGNTRLVSFVTAPTESFSVIAGSDTLKFVSSVAVAQDGTVWTAQSNSRGLLQLQADAVNSTVLQNITSLQLGTASIVAVAIDSASGAVFASDAVSSRVVRVDPTRGVVTDVYTSPTNDSRWQPRGIAINSGYLYVGDSASSTVMKLSVNSGALVQQYDVQSGLDFKSSPSGIAFDSVGNMFVADGQRVWKIDAVSGLLLAMWNGSTTGERTFFPGGLALDSGLLYISSRDRVLVFSDLNDAKPANAAQLSARPVPAMLLLALACHAIELLVSQCDAYSYRQSISSHRHRIS